MNKIRTFNGLVVWFITTLYVVYSFTLNTAQAVFSTSIQESLHITKIDATIALTAFIVGFALMQIPAGHLLDKYRAKFVVSTGILILACGNILASLATSLTLLTIANFIQGIAAAFPFVAVGVLIGQWFQPKLFPILFGLTQTLSCILSGILHSMFYQALQEHSWNSIYLSLSVFGFILFILALLFVRNPKEIDASAQSSLGHSLKIISKNPQLWLCAIAAATSFGVLLAYASFWFLKIQNFYDVSSSGSMLISAVMFAGIGLGTPLLGLISNKFKSRKGVIHISLSLGVIMLLFAIYSPHFSMESLIIIKIASFLVGFLLAGSMLFYTIVSEIFPLEVKGVALSVTNTFVFIFNSIMMFMPFIFVTSKTFFTSLWIFPAFILVSITLLYFVKESYKS